MTADDIKRKLFANPMFWVDKMCALQTALDDDTFPPDDPNHSHVVAELAEAEQKVNQLILQGKVTKEDVAAEIKFQEDNA